MTHEILICIFSAIAGGMVGFIIGGLIVGTDIEKHCKGKESKYPMIKSNFPRYKEGGN